MDTQLINDLTNILSLITLVSSSKIINGFIYWINLYHVRSSFFSFCNQRFLTLLSFPVKSCLLMWYDSLILAFRELSHIFCLFGDPQMVSIKLFSNTTLQTDLLSSHQLSLLSNYHTGNTMVWMILILVFSDISLYFRIFSCSFMAALLSLSLHLNPWLLCSFGWCLSKEIKNL